MTGQLLEGQFELDGFRFGEGTPYVVLTSGFDPGAADLRVQDADDETADETRFGRDYVTPPELSFAFGVRHGYDVEQAVAALRQAWRAAKVRRSPGAVSVLRWRQNGHTWQVHGRARKCDISPLEVRVDDFAQVLATFKTAAAEKYLEPDGGGRRELTLRLVEGPSGGGLVLPARLPWRLRPSSQARSGEVTVGGYGPAPFQIKVTGPVTGSLSDVKLSGNGWQIATSAPVAYGQELTIDTAARTILRDGASVAGTVGLGSRLDARLEPGHQFIKFDGNDPSNTATATVSWLDSFPL